MATNSTRCFLLLLLFFLQALLFTEEAEARAVPTATQRGYANELQLLGLTCRCCDGAGGECRSSWGATCARLDCKPWKKLF